MFNICGWSVPQLLVFTVMFNICGWSVPQLLVSRFESTQVFFEK